MHGYLFQNSIISRPVQDYFEEGSRSDPFQITSKNKDLDQDPVQITFEKGSRSDHFQITSEKMI